MRDSKVTPVADLQSSTATIHHCMAFAPAHQDDLVRSRKTREDRLNRTNGLEVNCHCWNVLPAEKTNKGHLVKFHATSSM